MPVGEQLYTASPGIAYRAILSSLELETPAAMCSGCRCCSRVVAVVIAADVVAVDIFFRLERPRLAL